MPDEDHYLTPIANSDNPGRKADVVFVHGLGGEACGTWRHGKQNEPGHFFWPEELGKDLPEYGIWVVGYPAGFVTWGEKGMPIALRSQNLGVKFQNKGLGDRP